MRSSPDKAAEQEIAERFNLAPSSSIIPFFTDSDNRKAAVNMITDEEAMQIISKATSTPFLIKLWTILSEPGYSHAITWNLDDGFTVHNTEALEQDVLPAYFRSTQFSSFQRQLNYFSFRKVGKKGYTHPLFIKAQPELVLEIKRKTNTGNLNKNRKAAAQRRKSTQRYDVGVVAIQNSTTHYVPSSPPNADLEEQPKKRARISPVAAAEYSPSTRPKILAVVPAPGSKIPSVRGSKKYDHDPNLQPVTPMTPFLADLADFNWTAMGTPRRSPRRSAIPNRVVVHSQATTV